MPKGTVLLWEPRSWGHFYLRLRSGFTEVETFDLSDERWVGVHVIGQRRTNIPRRLCAREWNVQEMYNFNVTHKNSSQRGREIGELEKDEGHEPGRWKEPSTEGLVGSPQRSGKASLPGLRRCHYQHMLSQLLGAIITPRP